MDFRIVVKKNKRFVKVSGGMPTVNLGLGLILLALQVPLARLLLSRGMARDVLLVWLLTEGFFGVVAYVVASWHPFRILLLKDEERDRLVFFAAPGCWRGKVYPLHRVSGFLVEDRGEWMGRLYVLAGGRHRVFDANLHLLRALASKAAEAFGVEIRYD